MTRTTLIDVIDAIRNGIDTAARDLVEAGVVGEDTGPYRARFFALAAAHGLVAAQIDPPTYIAKIVDGLDSTDHGYPEFALRRETAKWADA